MTSRTFNHRCYSVNHALLLWERRAGRWRQRDIQRLISQFDRLFGTDWMRAVKFDKLFTSWNDVGHAMGFWLKLDIFAIKIICLNTLLSFLSSSRFREFSYTRPPYARRVTFSGNQTRSLHNSRCPDHGHKIIEDTASLQITWTSIQHDPHSKQLTKHHHFVSQRSSLERTHCP